MQAVYAYLYGHFGGKRTRSGSDYTSGLGGDD